MSKISKAIKKVTKAASKKDGAKAGAGGKGPAAGGAGPVETKRDARGYQAPGGEVAGAPGTSSGTMPQPQDPSVNVGCWRSHGTTSRDMTAPRSSLSQGKFGRMFRKLAAWVPPGATETDKDKNIRALADTIFEAQGQGGPGALDNKKIPSAYTYFGQFVDHDITFDPVSSLAKLNDPDALNNFRTPRFDLDCIYGEGPDDEPFMYDENAPGKFLIGQGHGQGEADLPRNVQDVALIGDKRNDENIIVAQLQLTFLLLHNRILDRVVADEGLTGMAAFTRAQQVLRFHYQHVVLFDFLPRICGQDVVDSIIRPEDPKQTNLKFYDPKDSAYMPVEFSVAAYRMGHSMIRGRYDLNKIVRGIPIFVPKAQAGELEDLRGFRPLPGVWTLDWRLFMDLGGPAANIQLSRKIDSRLAGPLKALPPDQDSLATLNLLRGFRMGLPSGQAVARAMAVPELSNAQIGVDSNLSGPEAPLWLYILKEAEAGGGEKLGPVGARIVAEVFVGLAKNDPQSFINLDPGWSPEAAVAGKPLVPLNGKRLQLRDLVRAAGRDTDPFP